MSLLLYDFHPQELVITHIFKEVEKTVVVGAFLNPKLDISGDMGNDEPSRVQLYKQSPPAWAKKGISLLSAGLVCVAEGFSLTAFYVKLTPMADNNLIL